MTRPIMAVIAPGAMGAAVGARLSDKGADVITLLAGRSAASVERAAKARMRSVDDAAIAAADIISPSCRRARRWLWRSDWRRCSSQLSASRST